ncbi:TPA: FAD-dependent oxidoreductase [Burkholderia aenigmatica]|nr:FAD-dependent oxidoreductase [Burkholderia aenigmatica]HDR9513519.1 FAD-dependent oxidoreductase [Burkholderia aenigmatica]HDR9590910.1 FAD-dependent oxidoreductase [Burkholderia aenigmatica]HDR9601698.1 FAD-dependent oxidoreductase [Burkholderia aenigmatica]HDR9608564.1 FAD-dependent oxidoreductase [Burkholderia aenigmatica]
MSETTETQAGQKDGSRSAVSRRTFIKGAAAAAVVVPAVAATQCSRVESAGPVEAAKLTADMEKYRALGGWVERPGDMQPELTGDVSADVVIVGAGFAGLSAALELVRHGAKVVVLEREFAGFGASGRNAGYLAGALALEYDLFLKSVGNEKGKEIVRYYEDAVPFVEGKLKEYEIDCDYNQTGIIRAGIDPAQEDKVRDDMRTGAGLGFKSEFLDQAEMRARGIPPAFLFGNYVPRGGTLHPGKYVMGLRRAALRAGVKIYENTPLLSYTEGPVIKVQTPRGSASASVLMLATNAYTPQLGLLADKVVPLRVSAIETEPLSDDQRKALGWPRREGIVTAHWTMESHRLTVNNTLVVTTKRLHYPYGSKTPNVPDYESYRELRTALRDRFPTLKGIALRACWSGYISLASDALPVVGATGAHQNIFYSAGCSGHGVAAQSMVGSMIAGRIRGIENPLLSALDHKTPSTLPEPLRWCVMNGALGVVNALDDRVNGKARAAQARRA